MAVREALLGIMTLGPAYGLQLHAELCERAPHRAKTNVGQIYGTLERLVTAELVIRSGESVDRLPLYHLSSIGRIKAKAWLYGTDVVTAADWTELLDHIFIARSLNADALNSVVGVYEQILSKTSSSLSQAQNENTTMYAAAQRLFAEAARAWLGDVRRDMGLGETVRVRGYATLRPKRGRPTTS